MKSNCRARLGRTARSSTRLAMPRAIGLMKNGMGAFATRSKTSSSSSGGMAEPSAKCSQ